MIKSIYLIVFCTLLIGCNQHKSKKLDLKQTKTELNKFMDDWHRDVATFDYDAYFDKIDSLGYFIGTDASEVWTKSEFAEFSKPYFAKKQTWDFKALNRNIFIEKSGNIAWFNELLDTWMGLCRGSGILQKTNKGWKIKQYVLSMTIPNEDIKPVMAAKKVNDSIAKIKYK